MAKTISIYGKGGSGKSMVACNLSVQFARRGSRTLQIGCDPKHDSTRALTGGRRIATLLDVLQSGLDKREAVVPREAFLVEGLEGVGCVETGGPESGAGCAGLGIVSGFRLLDKQGVPDDFDVLVMDVLGDVVCGGFAMPLTRGLAGRVVIVVSDTLMSMYSANNIARAVRRYRRNGNGLAGLVVNAVRRPDRRTELEAFAVRLGTRILLEIPFAEEIAEAERRGVPVSVHARGGALDRGFARLARTLWTVDPLRCPEPTPMSDDEWDEFARGLGAPRALGRRPGRRSRDGTG